MEDVRAHGTADLLADVATQARLSDHVAPKVSLRPVPESATQGAWGAVYGELPTFDDPYSSLPPIRPSRGLPPGRSQPLYRRVLIPVPVNGAREVS